jgi:peptidoglycan LD-endopeptidase CwlK
MDMIIDSNLTSEDALKQNPNMVCPEEILARQRVIQVSYVSFDKELHIGQIVVDVDLINDVQDVFELLKEEQFPIASVIPISDPQFHWDDDLSMKANNASGFNYRMIMETKRLSNHAYGRAIDINPAINPYITKSGRVIPEGATYNTSKPGTISKDSKLIQFLKTRGWVWGGDWEDRKDYQHFEKSL